MERCVCCGTVLQGRQRKYCSRHCKNTGTNALHQSCAAQQRRGRRRKLRLLALQGGKCARCGYCSNFAALEFHHRDREAKRFQLDVRALSNRRWSVIVAEARKCVVLCANCHAEEHNPECVI